MLIPSENALSLAAPAPWKLKEYEFIRYGPKFFFLHHQGWSPPTGQVVTLLVYGLVTLAFAGVVATWIWFTPRAGESPSDMERIR